MDISNIASLLPAGFADNSRVWIYQSSRPFVEKEQKEIEEQLLQFYIQWQAHGAAVKGWAGLLFERFIVFIADEAEVQVSGCSIDSTVRLVKSIEKQYSITLFDRLSITFLLKEKADILPLNQVQYAIDKGYINGDTLLFNNIVSTKQEMETNWLQPLKNSWLAQKVKLQFDNEQVINK